MSARALIAEDEPLLSAHLRAELARAWPELDIVASVGDGAAALAQCLALRPDIAFLDIRMPGMSGLDVALALAEDWQGGPFPLLVFVTAYDQYAIQAFERAAFDYLLKPLQSERLALTCARLRTALQSRRPAAQRASYAVSDSTPHPAIETAFEALVARLRELPAAGAGPALPSASVAAQPLQVIQAAAGNAIHLVPVDEVLYFEAADKYVRMVTAGREYLLRTALRELQPQLDPARFWQIHRGTVVRCDAIERAVRDEAGKLVLHLRNHADRLGVSRLYAWRFKGM